MVTIDWSMGWERSTLIAALVLMWVWLTHPARARWIGRLRQQDLTLACGAAVLINLLLVAAMPHVSGLPQPAGGLLPALMRQMATLVIAAPLMLIARRWRAARCVGAR